MSAHLRELERDVIARLLRHVDAMHAVNARAMQDDTDRRAFAARYLEPA
jgi:hypothetical protein